MYEVVECYMFPWNRLQNSIITVEIPFLFTWLTAHTFDLLWNHGDSKQTSWRYFDFFNFEHVVMNSDRVVDQFSSLWNSFLSLSLIQILRKRQYWALDSYQSTLWYCITSSLLKFFDKIIFVCYVQTLIWLFQKKLGQATAEMVFNFLLHALYLPFDWLKYYCKL